MLSVDAVQVSEMELEVTDATRRPVGVLGACVSGGGGGRSTSGGNAFWRSSWNWAGNQCPDSGAPASAPDMWLLLRGLPPYVGSHIRSKPLPSLFGISVLDPSDSPGGLIQTYASMPGAGAARGRSPRPA